MSFPVIKTAYTNGASAPPPREQAKPTPPLSPKSTAEIIQRIRERMQEKGVLDENGIMNFSLLKKPLPALTHIQHEALAKFLLQPICILSRNGTIELKEKSSLDELFVLYGHDTYELVGSIVPYLLGPSYFLSLLQHPDIDIEVDSQILAYLEQEFTTLPQDIDCRRIFNEKLSKEELEQKFNEGVTLFSDYCNKNPYWTYQNAFTKKKHVYEEDKKHFYISGLHGKFLFNHVTKPWRLDWVDSVELNRLHLFTSDALRLNMSDFQASGTPPQVTTQLTLLSDQQITDQMRLSLPGWQALFDRLLRVARIDNPASCDQFAWFMLMVKLAKEHLFCTMKKEIVPESVQRELFQKVQDSPEYKEKGINFIISELYKKWETHLEPTINSLLQIAYQACSALSATTQDVTFIWKELTKKISFRRDIPEHLMLLHLLITRGNCSFQQAIAIANNSKELARKVPFILSKIEDVAEREQTSLFFTNFFQISPLAIFANEQEPVLCCRWLAACLATAKHYTLGKELWKEFLSQFPEEEKGKFAFGFSRLILEAHPTLALTIAREYIDQIETGALVQFLSRCMRAHIVIDPILLASACIHVARRADARNLSSFLAHVHTLSTIGRFELALSLVKALPPSDETREVVSRMCEQAFSHPQGGHLTSLYLWKEAEKADLVHLAHTPSFIANLIERKECRHDDWTASFLISRITAQTEIEELLQRLEELPPQAIGSQLQIVLDSFFTRRILMHRYRQCFRLLTSPIFEKCCLKSYSSLALSLSQAVITNDEQELLYPLLVFVIRSAQNHKDILACSLSLIERIRELQLAPSGRGRSALSQLLTERSNFLRVENRPDVLLALFELASILDATLDSKCLEDIRWAAREKTSQLTEYRKLFEMKGAADVMSAGLLQGFLELTIRSGKRDTYYDAYCIWKSAYQSNPKEYQACFQKALFLHVKSGDTTASDWLVDEEVRAPFIEELEQLPCKLILLPKALSKKRPVSIDLLMSTEIGLFHTSEEISLMWSQFLSKILTQLLAKRDPSVQVIRKTLKCIFEHISKIAEQELVPVINLLSEALILLLTTRKRITVFNKFYVEFATLLLPRAEIEWKDAVAFTIKKFSLKPGYNAEASLCRHLLQPVRKLLEIIPNDDLINLLFEHFQNLYQLPLPLSALDELLEQFVYSVPPECRYTERLANWIASNKHAIDSERGKRLELYLCQNVQPDSPKNAAIAIKRLLRHKSNFAMYKALQLLQRVQPKNILLAKKIATHLLVQQEVSLSKLWRALFLLQWSQDAFYQAHLQQEHFQLCKILFSKIARVATAPFPITDFPQAFAVYKRHSLPLVGLRRDLLKSDDFETYYAVLAIDDSMTLLSGVEQLLEKAHTEIEKNRHVHSSYFPKLYLLYLNLILKTGAIAYDTENSDTQLGRLAKALAKAVTLDVYRHHETIEPFLLVLEETYSLIGPKTPQDLLSMILDSCFSREMQATIKNSHFSDLHSRFLNLQKTKSQCNLL